MRLLGLSLLVGSLFGQTTNTSTIYMTPPAGGSPPLIQMKELKANGTNYINLVGPNSITTSFALQLPNAGSPGGAGVYYTVCSDSTNILTWCAPTGAGAYVDLTTNQTITSGTKTFIDPIEATGGITVGGTPAITNTRDGSFVNATVSTLLTASTVTATTSVGAPVGVFTNTSGTNSDFTTYKVLGTQVINGFREASFTNLALSGSATVNNAITATGLITGAGIISTNFVQATSVDPDVTQTRHQGGTTEQWGFIHTRDLFGYYQGTTQRYFRATGISGGTALELYDAAGTQRASWQPDGGFFSYSNSSGTGLMSLSTSGVVTGFAVQNGATYSADGSQGVDVTCPGGTYLYAPTIKKGIITAATCLP